MKWATYTLDEIKAEGKYTFVGGPFGSNLTSKDYIQGEGVPVIRGTNLPSGTRFSHDDLVFVSEDKANQLSTNLAYPNDVIFTQRGTLGQVGLIPEGHYDKYVVSQSQMKITVNRGIAIPEFVFYYFSSEEGRKMIEAKSITSGVPHINLGILKSTTITLPPLPTQRRIASILSAYDDLIDNNLRRIKLLEEAAQHIYREWFVRMRFPGWETAKFGEDGVPEGWRKVNLYDFAEIQMGYPFDGSLFNSEKHGMPAIRIRDIPSNWTSTYTPEEVDEKYIVEQGDILIGMDGFFYTDIWAGQRGYLVQRVCRIRAKNPGLQGFLLEAIKGPIKFFEQTISGATVAHLGAKHLKQIEILAPSVETRNDVHVFNELHNQRVNLHNQIAILKEARDILLPRLMNQTIEV